MGLLNPGGKVYKLYTPGTAERIWGEFYVGLANFRKGPGEFRSES